MITLISWTIALVLEALILFRCVKTGIVRSYPVFFTYLSCVFIGDLVLPPLSRIMAPRVYEVAYWAKEFVCVMVGYAVVMEAVDTAFAHFEGPKKLGRNAALVIFGAIVSFTALRAAFETVSSIGQTAINVEADLRGAELVLLSILILVVFYYRVSIGTNLKGIIVGYGICTVTVAVNEAMRTFAGASFQSAFSMIWSYTYFLSLLVWVTTLWSREASLEPVKANQMDGDYEALASHTKTTLAGMRGYLRKAVRS